MSQGVNLACVINVNETNYTIMDTAMIIIALIAYMGKTHMPPVVIGLMVVMTT